MGRRPSYEELTARIKELEAQVARGRKRSRPPSRDSVIVPEELRPVFAQAQETVGRYFRNVRVDPSQGMIEVWGERYVLVRASALSYNTLNTIARLYADRGERESLAIGKNFLFDISHIIGLNDARSFHEKMGLVDPLAKLSAGPVHFSHTGWALVEILPESHPSPDDDYCMIYRHPFSFEADAWIRAGQRTTFPVCIMNAGYSSGWCEESFGLPLTAVEISCRAKGDENCTFIMAPPHRIEEHLARRAPASPDGGARASVTYDIPTFFDRKQTEDALALKHKQLLSIFDSIDEIVYVADPVTHEVLYANRHLKETFGDVEGRKCHEALQRRDTPCEFCTNPLIFGENEGQVHIWDRETNGRWYHSIDKAIHWPDGRTVRVEMAIDITQRKAAEQQAQKLEEALRQSQKLEAIGTLAGGVAHDLNNILSAIMGLASALQLRGDGDTQTRQDLGGILDACRKGRDLTSNLLGFARKGTVNRERFSLNRSVQEVRELLKRTLPKRIVIEPDLEADLANIEGDPGQINHALVNLALNSAYAMHGRGTLTFSTRTVVLEPQDLGGDPELRPGLYVRLKVVDTGVGMDPETLEHAFEPFFTTKPKGEGTGLGLSLVYGAVKSHDGQVQIESEVGRGTTVTIHLPAVARAARPAASADPLERDRAKRRDRMILLVDDEAMVRASGLRMLETLGYRVLLAENGRAAVDLYRKHRASIGLVILDLVMPLMDGPETFHRLKGIDPEIRILLSSGYTKAKAMDPLFLGAAGFLQKPYDIDQLSEKLDAALGADAS